jgi:hypothetical protein
MKARYFWLWILGLSVGWFEAAVVVYLRKLYYPAGFAFPIVLAPSDVGLVEVAREAASLLLLAAGARLAGAFFIERFAAFMILFGVWDLVYYAALKAVLDWPATWGTWDVLFLIPVPWIGPVWAPTVVSLALVGVGSYLYLTPQRARRITATDAAVEIAAGLVVILSFTLDWRVVVESRMPGRFPSEIFWAGFCLALVWFVRRERQVLRAEALVDPGEIGRVAGLDGKHDQLGNVVGMKRHQRGA